MEIKTSLLIEALNTIKSVSSDNLTAEEDNLVIFAFGQVIAQNEQCYISTLFDHELEECTLPYNKLFTLLSAFKPDRNLSLKMENQNIRLEFEKDRKKSNTKLAAYTNKEFDYIDPPNTGWKEVPTEFVNALKKSKVSLPTESLRSILTSYGVKNNKVTTSDDFRASEFEMSTGFNNEFALSGKLGQLIIENHLSKYIVDGNIISFKNDNVFVTAPLSIETYPELNSEIFSFKNSIKLITQDFIKALDRSVLFAEGLSNIDYAVSFNINGKHLEINAANKYGKNKEVIELIFSNSADKNLSINPVYLSQILKMLSGKDVEVGITEENNLVFNENGFNHLIASYVE